MSTTRCEALSPAALAGRARRGSAAAALLAAIAGGAAPASPGGPPVPPPAEAAAISPSATLEVPSPDLGVALLAARRQAQIAAARGAAVAHDFRLEDRRPESGITFRHQATEDGTKAYKMVHYDHGNGLAVADVDGDGRLDVYFVSQLGGNALWRNLGGGRFRDATAEAGVALADRIGVSASFADYDNDGDPDLFVTTVRTGNVLLANDGRGRFRDVTATAGVGYSGHSSGAVFFDYDGDGRLDLFVANVGRYTGEERGPGGYYIGLRDAFQGHLHPERAERSLLYRNLGGGRFREVGEEVGLVDLGWSGDAAFTDFDGDGDPDLYVPDMQGDDHYWENEGGRRFVERTREYFPLTPWGTMGVQFFDFDNDGRQDLFLTDMHSDMSQEVAPYAEELKSEMIWSPAHLQGGEDNVFGNAFYRNLGPSAGATGAGRVRFEEVSDLVGAENYWPWGLSVGDLNADGFLDAFVCASMSYPWRYGINNVLLNDGGRRFVDAEFLLGVEPRRDGLTKIPYFDLDCSGADAGHDLCRGRQGRLAVLGNVGTRGAVLFDLDGDGDLDAVTGEFHWLPQVLVSDLAQRRRVRHLTIRLSGRRSNRDGLGARVTVRAAGQVQTRTHDGKSGYLAQSSMPLYFGLGEAERVDEVIVEWPSGRRSVLREGIGIDRLLTVREP